MNAIILNGKTHELFEGTTLAILIHDLGLEKLAIAAAVNHLIIQRVHWESCPLEAGDHVDLVKAIGGG